MTSKGVNSAGSSRSSTPDVFENEFSDEEAKSDAQENKTFNDTDDEEVAPSGLDKQKHEQIDDPAIARSVQKIGEGPPIDLGDSTAVDPKQSVNSGLLDDQHGEKEKRFNIECEIESDSEVTREGCGATAAAVISLDEGEGDDVSTAGHQSDRNDIFSTAGRYSDRDDIFSTAGRMDSGQLETDAYNINTNTVDAEREEMDTGEALPDPRDESHDDDSQFRTTASMGDVLHMFDWEIPAVAFDTRPRADSHLHSNAGAMKEKIVEALKLKKHKYPRIFHTKSNPGREPTEDRYGSGLFGRGSGGSGSGGMLKRQMEMYSPMARLSSMAKAMKLDVTQLFEMVEKTGLTRFSFPCMQCYEKYGGLAGSKAGGGGMGGGYADDDYYDEFAGGGSERSTDGKCTRCGGAVTTLSSYRQMILKMREKLRAKHLLVHDVYPDGNCLFGAVIDQLRIMGDFRFTITTLRQGAVDYLRENPESDDGTHYAMFLTDETWEAYLTRMSLDGVWGDHMVLNAIATIVNHPLTIYGGPTGDGETVIYPKGCQPPPDDPKKSDEKPDEEEEKKEEKVDSKASTESPPLPGSCESPPLYLGHFGESHYISLRPAAWRDSLQDSIYRSTDLEPDSTMAPLQELARRSLPAYCDSLLKTLFHLEYITSFRSDAIDVISPGRLENDKFVYEMMGSLINKLQPSICEIESIGPDVDLVFPGLVESATQKKKAVPMLVLFCTPTDTRVCFNSNNARRFDLICERTESDLPGQMKLVPNNPELWNSVLDIPESGSCVIKAFEVRPETETYFPVLYEFPDIGVSPVIAFRCRWPNEAYDWIARQRNAGWLDDDFIKGVVSGYCHIIPALPTENLSEVTCDFASPDNVDGQTWLISFAAAEKKLLHHISSNQRHSFLLLQLYLSNLATEKMLSATEEGSCRQLPSSLAKSIFFYACENIEASVWEKHPGICFMKLLQNLAIALEDEYLPHFFIPEKNLLQFVPREITLAIAQRLRSYCSQPFVGLYFFLDQYSITTSEVGPFIDGIIEELFNTDQERDEESFFLQVVLPSFSTMLNACSMQEEYRDAELLAKMIREEILNFYGKSRTHRVSENGPYKNSHTGTASGKNQDSRSPTKNGGDGEWMPMSTILSSCVDNKTGGYCWCLALYMDLVNDTLISREVHGDRPTVSIAEIFGPECTEELPDTLVDAGFKIQHGDLVFATYVESILSLLGKDRAITRCFRYYVDTLHDLAGEKIVMGSSSTGCGHACSHLSLGAASMYSLFMLYIKLYNAYLRLNCVEEFRDLLPTFTKMADHLGTASCYTNLRAILRGLKEYDKAKEVGKKMTRMPQGLGSGGSSSSLMQVMSQILSGGMPMDGYGTETY